MNLANALQLTGHVSEALDLYERAIAIDISLFGPTHPVTAQSINNYGAALFRAGRVEAALAQFERSLAAREAAFGAEHPRVAASLKNTEQTR